MTFIGPSYDCHAVASLSYEVRFTGIANSQE